MDRLREILENNYMYDDYNDYGSNLGNLEEEFEKTYKFNPTNKHMFPDIERNNEGYIILNNIPFLYSLVDETGHRKKFWILLNNGSKVLLKEGRSDLELLFEGLSKQLEIPNAKYDIAILNDKIYTVSLSFLNNKEYLYDKYSIRSDFNLRARNTPQKIITNEIDPFLKQEQNQNIRFQHMRTIFIDSLTNHYDRIPNNLKLIVSNNKLKASPLFDNEYCCEKCFDKKEKYNVFSNSDDFGIQSVIPYLFNNNNFRQYIKNRIDNINVDKITEIIKKEKKIIINPNDFSIFNDTVNENLYSIKKYIK